MTPAQYDEVRGLVNWDGDAPKGGMYHVAAFDKDGLRVTDEWESAGDFEVFVAQRQMPGVQKAGLTTQPEVEIMPVHAVFAPGYGRRQ